MKLDASYWGSRYKNKETGWDTGQITTPLKAYFDQLTDKSITILIPGAGMGYEAEYLFSKGFTCVYVVDIAKQPLLSLKARCPGFPNEQLLHADFFSLENITFDLIVEQTFFCALLPGLRPNYTRQMHKLLKPGGKLIGLLFNDELNKEQPPFGGTRSDYLSLFQKYFELKHFNLCYNSIAPRRGRELFICCLKKQTTS